MVIGGPPLEKIWLLVWNVICISEGVLSVLELEESEDDFNDYEDDVFHLESHHGEYECGYGEKGFHLINTLHTIQ